MNVSPTTADLAAGESPTRGRTVFPGSPALRNLRTADGLEWREFRRNVFEDYRLVFGEEPWDIVAVGVMSDTGNSRQKARTQYGDITFLPAR